LLNQQLRKSAQDVVGSTGADSQMESRTVSENIFAVARAKTAAESVRGRGLREEGRSGDDLGGLVESREGARHEGDQGQHEAAKPDEHWRGSFLRRVSGEVKLGAH
jgi:hypothetical protein